MFVQVKDHYRQALCDHVLHDCREVDDCEHDSEQTDVWTRDADVGTHGHRHQAAKSEPGLDSEVEGVYLVLEVADYRLYTPSNV